jgi:hypothetical protein
MFKGWMVETKKYSLLYKGDQKERENLKSYAYVNHMCAAVHVGNRLPASAGFLPLLVGTTLTQLGHAHVGCIWIGKLKCT